MTSLIRFLSSIVLLSIPWMLFAADSNLNQGATYLANAQNGQTGLWTTGAADAEIAAWSAILAFEKTNLGASSLASAKESVLQGIDPETESITNRALLVLAKDPVDLSPLLSTQNSDGGWGATIAKESNPLSTMIALETLLTVASPSEATNNAATYLANAQTSDGSWPVSVDASYSKIELTGHVVRLLASLRSKGLTDLNVDNAIGKGANYLRVRIDANLQAADAESEMTITAVASVYRALVKLDPPALHTLIQHRLIESQQPDGSWITTGQNDKSVYSTAMVMLALDALQLPEIETLPDLQIFNAGISFSPQIANQGDLVGVTVVVFNSGDVVAQSVSVSLYLQDPHSGVAPHATGTIAAILPQKSATVTLNVETTGLAESPRVFAFADPDNQIGETSEANNLAHRVLPISGLPNAETPIGTDLTVLASEVTLNAIQQNTVFLTGTSTVRLAFVVANLGANGANNVLVEVSDGNGQIAALELPSIAFGAPVAVEIPWRPTSGDHVLTISVDPQNAVPEFNEANNVVAKSVTVIAAAAAIIVKRFANGIEDEPPLRPYDTARLTVATAHLDVHPVISIRNQDGELAGLEPISLSAPNKYEWNAQNLPAGTYVASATFLADADDSVVASAETQFELLPVAAVRGVRLFVDRKQVEGGNVEPIGMQVLLENGSNVPSSWGLSWELVGPSGIQAASSNETETVNLTADESSRIYEIQQPISGLFSETGQYEVTITVADANGVAVATASDSFSLLPSLNLGVVNRVIPNAVSPLGTTRVTTQIRLTASGSAGDLTIPVAVREITNDTNPLIDSPAVQTQIALNGVLNVLGTDVPDGTKIAVFIPYGELLNGELPPKAPADADGSPPNPQIRIYAVANGNVNLAYRPRGTGLNANENSTTVLEVHQFFENETKWFGKTIGTTEILLEGN